MSHFSSLLSTEIKQLMISQWRHWNTQRTEAFLFVSILGPMPTTALLQVVQTHCCSSACFISLGGGLNIVKLYLEKSNSEKMSLNKVVAVSRITFWQFTNTFLLWSTSKGQTAGGGTTFPYCSPPAEILWQANEAGYVHINQSLWSHRLISPSMSFQFRKACTSCPHVRHLCAVKGCLSQVLPTIK